MKKILFLIALIVTGLYCYAIPLNLKISLFGRPAIIVNLDLPPHMTVNQLKIMGVNRLQGMGIHINANNLIVIVNGSARQGDWQINTHEDAFFILEKFHHNPHQIQID